MAYNFNHVGLHTSLEEFENGVFCLKKKLFSVHTLSEKFENRTITRHFGFMFEEDSIWKSRDHRDVSVLVELCFYYVFCLHKNEEPSVSKFSSLKVSLEKLRSRD